ncbi:alkylation response protein AidB-like acyl-CoA dehydrogenase [Povalibacter uvarum]|uniref:Alkylation response protein AidB-like acyl-CoA dehydrogenase n=1 Tax=Povalibacter uvarum TaxID=732238 RepID=A0A841HN88_9GAMM|nr:acyl-CoA dehydrogenase family protein [Povalibacter uvarum]MBB6094336.1 alkylation response protein AidB-like acyl-CoA dehydrogenase [Povalibacter uvarum]
MSTNIFIQSPPRIGNQYRDDALLKSWLRRKLPADMLREIESELDSMGELAGGELYELQLQDRLREPELTQWDAWGNRIDRIEVTPLWARAAQVAVRSGLIAIPYERRHGRHSRIHQFALVYLFHPSSDVYTCPLAMTDGAARTLGVSGNAALAARAIPRLTSRNPADAWTSGQWMTESTGGSDVGISLTQARHGDDGRWRLYGKKWFTSAITSQMALTLARPEGNGPGGSGLAMFYVETHDQAGGLNGIRVERLKDKLGTRKVPTAELLLDGAVAELVGDTRNGTRNIEPMLVVTRAWNSVTSAAFMRRGVALAKAYAGERRAFGSSLEDLPLHVDTLAGLEAETRAATLLAFELVELMGRLEANEMGDHQRALLRLLTPIAKLLTAKQAVAVTSEAIEAFGGAGYVEDTGLPALLRDTQVLPIWEGTTNVLALDALLRGDAASGLRALIERVAQCRSLATDARLGELAAQAAAALDHVVEWLGRNGEATSLQAGARRVVMTIGRAWQLMLLIEHAQWELDAGNDRTGIAAASRFAASPVDLLATIPLEDSRSLLR